MADETLDMNEDGEVVKPFDSDEEEEKEIHVAAELKKQAAGGGKHGKKHGISSHKKSISHQTPMVNRNFIFIYHYLLLFIIIYYLLFF